jgi:hypothetical protein
MGSPFAIFRLETNASLFDANSDGNIDTARSNSNLGRVGGRVPIHELDGVTRLGLCLLWPSGRARAAARCVAKGPSADLKTLGPRGWRLPKRGYDRNRFAVI